MANRPLQKPGADKNKDSDGYETFQSGRGPLIDDRFNGDYSERDGNLPDEGVEHGAVPEMPQKSR